MQVAVSIEGRQLVLRGRVAAMVLLLAKHRDAVGSCPSGQVVFNYLGATKVKMELHGLLETATLEDLT